MSKKFKPSEELVKTVQKSLLVEDQWAEIGLECIALVNDRNRAYGSSFETAADIMSKFYPDGISPDQYQDATIMIRVLDKLNRIATDKRAFGESPWRDILGYAMLAYHADIEKGKAHER